MLRGMVARGAHRLVKVCVGLLEDALSCNGGRGVLNCVEAPPPQISYRLYCGRYKVLSLWGASMPGRLSLGTGVVLHRNFVHPSALWVAGVRGACVAI